MDLTGLTDDRNLKLWSDLTSQFEIQVTTHEKTTYGVFTIFNQAIIYVPSKQRDSASFTHELLHIFLKTKNVQIAQHLKLQVQASSILAKILSKELLEHVGNCLEHVKMLPIFLKMGYNEEDFISDYCINKLPLDHVRIINRHFKVRSLFSSHYNSAAIDLFIGKYFAVKACPNKTFNYSKSLSGLKSIDHNLFQLLEIFMQSWKQFDFEVCGSTDDNIYPFLTDFTEELTRWTKKKKIKFPDSIVDGG